ncbi:NAD-dependent protein deacylase [Luoshenia tenuis]|uniref:NAD-dependent protein deacylase n=1 Tax=Luoshenia tenuis TaxID=2763654 RepID=UPI003D92BBD4
MDEAIKELREQIMVSRSIVFFGGAGVSTESGIPDFRSTDGLYHQKYALSPEEILSHHYFMAQPEGFFRFYRDKMLYLEAKPNPAHRALAKLEKMGRLKAVITQNIDGLHQAAGSKNVLELHGSVHRNHCMACGHAYGVEAILTSEGVPRCSCGGIIKPDVVLYEEALDEGVLDAAVAAIASADLLIVGGTSLSVYPAAGLIDYFTGRCLAAINRQKIGRSRAQLEICGAIGAVFAALNVDKMEVRSEGGSLA